MAGVYSAFANNGNMINLYLEYSENAQTQIDKSNVFTEYAANTIKDDLLQVVENPKGTGHQAYMEDIKIAGKTGTAEIKKDQNDNSGTEIGWFNCLILFSLFFFCVVTAFYAPLVGYIVLRHQDEVKNNILIVSMVEDVKYRGGSHYVVPKVRNIIEFYLQKDN